MSRVFLIMYGGSMVRLFRTLVPFLIFLLTLTSCGKNKSAERTDNKEYYFSKQEKQLDETKGNVVKTVFYDKSYYILCESEGLYTIYEYTHELKYTGSVSINTDSKTEIEDMSVAGSFFFEERDEAGEHRIRCVNKDGTESQTEIDDDFLSKDHLNSFLADGNGYVYLANSEKVAVYDQNLHFKGTIFSEEGNLDDISCGSGHVVTAIFEKNTVDNAYTDYSIVKLNAEKLNFEKITDIEDAYLDKYHNILINSITDDIIFRDYYGIYVCKNKKTEKILDYTSSLLLYEETDGFINSGENEFSNIVNVDGKVVVEKYRKDNQGLNLAGKKVITYGEFGASNDRRAVIEFNRENNDYYIDVKDYGLSDDAIVKYNLDFSKKEQPDIMNFSGVSPEKYIEKGAFEDLSGYIQNDSSLEKADFIDSYINALTRENGEIYYISPSFTVMTPVTKANHTLTEYDCTFDEMFDYIGEHTGEKLLFDNNRWMIYYTFFEGDCSSYVDYRKHECHFDSNEFRNTLRLCYDYGDKGEFIYDASIYENMEQNYRDDKVLFECSSSGPEAMEFWDHAFGSDFMFAGYPDSGTKFNLTNMLCISADSDKKDGCWEFIRGLLSPEYQSDIATADGEYVPVRKDSYADLCRHLTENKEDEDATLSQQDVEKFSALIDETNTIRQDDYQLMTIIDEEVNAFFSDEHDLETTIQLIQNRATTYIQENE